MVMTSKGNLWVLFKYLQMNIESCMSVWKPFKGEPFMISSLPHNTSPTFCFVMAQVISPDCITIAPVDSARLIAFNHNRKTLV